MRIREIAVFVLVVTLAGFATAARASASPQDDVMATIHQFINGFNRGDEASAVATCAQDASIIDDFPPHEWNRPQACSDWWAALAAYDKEHGMSSGTVALGTPWHLSVTDNRGYVVVPATYSYKQNGKPTVERGSVFTVALRKTSAGWRITGWAWSSH
ncbi:MAG: hypothetical protein WA814_12775 [Candidatus Baltobacteraceae bacterium]